MAVFRLVSSKVVPVTVTEQFCSRSDSNWSYQCWEFLFVFLRLPHLVLFCDKVMDWSWNSNLSLNLKPLTEKRVCNWETREVFSFLVTSPSSHNYRRLIPTCFFPRARLISFWRQWLEVPSYGWMALVLPWAVGKAGMAEAACPLQGFLMWDTPHPVADFSQSGVCTTVFRESMSLYIASFLCPGCTFSDD